MSDGGSRIIAYVLEVLNGEDKWKELLRSKNMQYSAKDLVAGREYKYRVMATNDAGDGPVKELSIVAKDVIGEISFYLIYISCLLFTLNIHLFNNVLDYLICVFFATMQFIPAVIYAICQT